MTDYISLDSVTKGEILRIYRQGLADTEAIAEYFGIPESLVTKVLTGKL